jgi:hypothetical protein
MRFFCSGVTRPNTEEGLEDLAEFGIVFGQLARVVALGDVEADLARDRRHGSRIVAGDDPDADPLSAEVGERVRGIGSHLLAEGQHDGGDHIDGQPFGLDVGLGQCDRGVGQHERPTPGRGQFGDGAAEFLGGIGCGVPEHHLGGTQHPGAAACE